MLYRRKCTTLQQISNTYPPQICYGTFAREKDTITKKSATKLFWQTIPLQIVFSVVVIYAKKKGIYREKSQHYD
jgi:hypothetical protein